MRDHGHRGVGDKEQQKSITKSTCPPLYSWTPELTFYMADHVIVIRGIGITANRSPPPSSSCNHSPASRFQQRSFEREAQIRAQDALEGGDFPIDLVTLTGLICLPWICSPRIPRYSTRSSFIHSCLLSSLWSRFIYIGPRRMHWIASSRLKSPKHSSTVKEDRVSYPN